MKFQYFPCTPRILLWLLLVSSKTSSAIIIRVSSTKNGSPPKTIETASIQLHHNYSKVNIYSSITSSNHHLRSGPGHVSSEALPMLDPYQSTKEAAATTVTLSSPCPQNVTGQFVYDLNCYQYWNCWRGRGFLQACAAGTLFDPIRKHCNFPSRVKCSTPRHDSSNDSNDINPRDLRITAPECPPNFFGVIPDYLNCSRYWHCSNGLRTVATCDSGALFDIDSNRCRSAATSRCFIRRIQRAELNSSSSALLRPTSHPLPPPSNHHQVECPPDYSGLWRHPDDCSKFLSCANRRTFVMDCAPGTLFNPNSLICDFPGRVDCGSPQPPPLHLDGTVETPAVVKDDVVEEVAASNLYQLTTVVNASKVLTGVDGDVDRVATPNDATDYYYCRYRFRCGDGGNCIELWQVCDFFRDCDDGTDENGCLSHHVNHTVELTDTFRAASTVQVTMLGKVWHICAHHYSPLDGAVICKQLGHPVGTEPKPTVNLLTGELGRRPKPWNIIGGLNCAGNESQLIQCRVSDLTVNSCSSAVLGLDCVSAPQQATVAAAVEDSSNCANTQSDFWPCGSRNECIPIAFICDGVDDCTDRSDEAETMCDAPVRVRLSGGHSSNGGRLEVRHHGIWGTVCDDDFNEDAAKVVCALLGYQRRAATVLKNAHFGPGSGPIWLDQVICTGNESTIDECHHWHWGEHNCDHSEDVSIICSSNTAGADDDHIRGHDAEVWPPPPPPPPTPQPIVIMERHSASGVCGQQRVLHVRKPEYRFRVVGGAVAAAATSASGAHPWQAALRIRTQSSAAPQVLPSHWCGAVILAPTIVVTAAHCLTGYAKGAYLVAAGDYDLDAVEGTEQVAFIEEYRIHEGFRRGGHKMNNDVAVVRLKGAGFTFNAHVNAVCLPMAATPYDGRNLTCTIAGFGFIASGVSAFSHNLRAANVSIQDRAVCRMPHVYGDAITDGMFCAGDLNGGTDACDGDSGGPLVCHVNGVHTLYGITSWGQHCGYANKPGVYVKVAHYRHWIDETIDKLMAL